MKSDKPLKTVEAWLTKNKHIVDEYHIECDGYNPEYGDYSYWVYFKKGWINSMTETHCIHGATARDIIAESRYVERCQCERCTGL